LLGYPDAALSDTGHALKDAREIALMYALFHASLPHIWCGNYATTNEIVNELVALADERGAWFWKVQGRRAQGQLLALTHKATDAVQILISASAEFRSTGSTAFVPLYFSYLARAYADLGQFDDAWRCIGEAMTAMETTKETWFEADVHRIAGEVALMSPSPDAVKAEENFDRALAVARQQQAKSLELRASMSLARLWRDQGKPQQARDLLAPVYGWFTEGFDTRDLKEAEALLGTLAL
jgi:predicted ATPase